MKPECVEAVRAAAKELFGPERKVSDAELRGIEERLRGSMVEIARKDPSAWHGMSPAARYKAATDLAHTKLVEDMARAHQDAIVDAMKKAREWQELESYKPGLRGQLAALDQRTIFDTGNVSGRQSVETEARAIANEFLSHIAELPDGDKLFDWVQNRAREDDIIRGLSGEKVADPENAKAAGLLKKLFDAIHQRKNDAGIRVHYLDNWRAPQPWDWTKVGGVMHDEFVNDAMAHVDRASYLNPDGSRMDDAQLRAFIDAAAETIGTDGANKEAAREGRGGHGRVGGASNMPRQFHFASAADYRFMMDKYGSASNLYQLIHHHVSRAARDIAVAERYGRDADNFFPQLVAKAFVNDSKGLTGAELEKLKAQKKRLLDRWEAMRRPSAPGTSASGAASQNARGLVASAMLGGSVFYAPQDLATAALYAKTSGLTLDRWTANTAKALTAGKAGRARYARLGLVVDAIHDAGNRLGLEELGSRVVRFINHGVYVLSGTRRLDIGLRGGIGESVMDILGGLTRKANTMADLAEGDRAYLARTGASEDHFAVWKKAELGMEGGSPDLLTPHAIYAIPDEALRPMAERRMAAVSESFKEARAKARGNPELAAAFEKQHGEAIAREIRQLRSGAAKQLLSTALAEVQTGARAGAGGSIADEVRLGLTKNPQRTPVGELLSWLFLLKKTPLGIFHTHLFAMPRRFETWQGRLAYRAAFAATGLATGALAIQLRNLAAGNDPEDMATWDFAKKMALASGGMGLWGDFILADKGDQSTSALVRALGPGATAINDALNLFLASQEKAGQAFDQDAAGRQNYGAQALRFARSYALPFARIWYLKAAFNHLIYEQAMEDLAPGYKDRVRQRMAKRGQGSWWGPAQSAPERAPNLRAAFGESP